VEGEAEEVLVSCPLLSLEGGRVEFKIVSQKEDHGHIVEQCLWGIGGKCEHIKQDGGSQ